MSGSARVRRGAGGRWEVRPYLSRNRVTGARYRPYKSWPGELSEEEAQREADEWLARIAPGASGGRCPQLDSMLLDYIHDPARKKGLAGSTVSTYESVVRCHVSPTIGSVPYADLQPGDVVGAYRVLLTGLGGRRPISRGTLRKMHSLLSGAYRAWQPRLGRNPMLEVPAPSPDAVRPVSLDEWDQDVLVEALLGAMGGDASDRRSVLARSTAMAAYLALMLGLRCGEVCALTWRDWRRGSHDVHVGATMVDKPRLARNESPKRGSVGNVSAGAEVEEALSRHLEWQRTWMDAAGPDVGIVSTRADGACPSPDAVSRRFTRLAREAGMPEGTTMHTLRHTHATWLLMHGFDMRTIQERLRHKDVATTLRFYSSVLPGRDADAAAAFARAHAGKER